MDIDLTKEINDLLELDKINSESLVKNQKKKKIVQFLIQKDLQPNLTAHQLAKQVNSSLSTINRIRTDLNLKSFFRYDTPTKKTKILKPEEGQYSCSDCQRGFMNQFTYEKHRNSSIHYQPKEEVHKKYKRRKNIISGSGLSTIKENNDETGSALPSEIDKELAEEFKQKLQNSYSVGFTT